MADALSCTEEEDEIDPLDAFMMGNNAAGATQQQQPVVKSDPDPQAGPSSRPPLAGGPAVNGKANRAPARRGKRSMYDTDSSEEEEDEDEEEQSDEEDDEVGLVNTDARTLSPGMLWLLTQHLNQAALAHGA